MGSNQILFWEIFLVFCLFMLGIAEITHRVILWRDKKKRKKGPAKKKAKASKKKPRRRK